jgi:hypothetical protein
MKNGLTFLFAPLLAVCLATAAWGQQAPPAPASTPQAPGSMGANSTTDKSNARESKTTSGKKNKGTNRDRTRSTKSTSGE